MLKKSQKFCLVFQTLKEVVHAIHASHFCALCCVLCAVLSLKGKQLGLDCDVCSQIGEGKNNEKLMLIVVVYYEKDGGD